MHGTCIGKAADLPWEPHDAVYDWQCKAIIIVFRRKFC